MSYVDNPITTPRNQQRRGGVMINQNLREFGSKIDEFMEEN